MVHLNEDLKLFYIFERGAEYMLTFEQMYNALELQPSQLNKTQRK